MRLRLAPVALLLAAIGSGCGGSSTTSPAPVSTVTATLAASTVGAGLTTQASAVLRDASGNVLTGRSVTWSATPGSVATVSSTGLVSTIGAGTATITATSEGQVGSATLTVTVNPVVTVTVTLASSTLVQGAGTQATATLRDGSGNVVAGRPVTWSSASTGVASVTSTGVVTAVGPGSVFITATCEGRSGSATLTVNPLTVSSVTVSLSSPVVGIGRLSQGAAVVKEAGGNVLSGVSLSWASSASAVASVSATGVVTGVGLGTSTITATSGGVSGTATITVAAMYDVTALVQTAAPGTAVVQPPAVRVTDATGAARAGVPVAFTVTAGGGSVVGSPATTDASGVARLSSWTFGPAGAQAVTASSTAVPGVAIEFAGLSRPASAGYDITLRTSLTSDAHLRAFVDAKERIQQFVVGDVPDQPLNISAAVMAQNCEVNVALDETVDDVLVYASISNIDGPGGVLAQAGYCVLRSAVGLPVVGVMQFDSSDVASLEAGGALEATILHEMMHVLGFGTQWPVRGLLGAPTTTLPYFTGAAARSAFVTYNGGGSYPSTPVPVEGSSGSPGTDYSHWREADFDDELMTGFLDRNVPEAVSATTVASMQDLGYVVDLSRADPFRWGSATVALRRAASRQPIEPPFHLLDDVRRIPPVVIGPDGRPLFP